MFVQVNTICAFLYKFPCGCHAWVVFVCFLFPPAESTPPFGDTRASALFATKKKV